jgi:hypothetical protein
MLVSLTFPLTSLTYLLFSPRSTQASAFAQSSKNLRQHLWWQNVKMMVAIGVLCAVRPV